MTVRRIAALSIFVATLFAQTVRANGSEYDFSVTVNGRSGEKPGPTVTTGLLVQFAYVFTNNSETTVDHVQFVWRQKLPQLGERNEACELPDIPPGETRSCASRGDPSAIEGRFKATGGARFTLPSGELTELPADIFYTGIPVPGPEPGSGVAIRVTVNDENTVKPGPLVDPGSNITFIYSATNNGDSALMDAEIRTRRKLPTLSDYKTVCAIGNLGVGETGSCDLPALALEGVYKELAVVIATTATGTQIQDQADVFYQGVAGNGSGLTLQVRINDRPSESPGPSIVAGTTVAFGYLFTNNSDMTVRFLQIRKRRKLPTLGQSTNHCEVRSPRTMMPGESRGCGSGFEDAVEGQYKALVAARIELPSGEQIEVPIEAFYTGVAISPVTTGN